MKQPTVRERAARMVATANHDAIARAVAGAARAGADDAACAAVLRAAQHKASTRFPERLRRVEVILEAADLEARIALEAELI